MSTQIDRKTAALVGERLKALRRYRCMTQSALAADQLTRNMLSQIERGVSFPSYSTICYLSRALNVDPGYFFENGPTLNEIILSDALARVRANFDAERYDLCISEAQSLSKEAILASKTFSSVLCRCYYFSGVEAFSRGKLDLAKSMFSQCEEYSLGSFSGEVLKARVRFYTGLIALFSSSEPLNPVSVFSLIGEDRVYSDEVRYVFLNLLVDSGRIDDALRIYEFMNIREPFYKSHFNARVAASMNNYERAKSLLREILSDPQKIPHPFVFRAFEDLERYCKATDDYEGAYRCAISKTAFSPSVSSS